jgi:hypothetical protein
MQITEKPHKLAPPSPVPDWLVWLRTADPIEFQGADWIPSHRGASERNRYQNG